eukprot:1184967-Prorocentrum_minimum.AAC.1
MSERERERGGRYEGWVVSGERVWRAGQGPLTVCQFDDFIILFILGEGSPPLAPLDGADGAAGAHARRLGVRGGARRPAEERAVVPRAAPFEVGRHGGQRAEPAEDLGGELCRRAHRHFVLRRVVRFCSRLRMGCCAYIHKQGTPVLLPC